MKVCAKVFQVIRQAMAAAARKCDFIGLGSALGSIDDVSMARSGCTR
jgi:hypothetical protein